MLLHETILARVIQSRGWEVVRSLGDSETEPFWTARKEGEEDIKAITMQRLFENWSDNPTVLESFFNITVKEAANANDKKR